MSDPWKVLRERLILDVPERLQILFQDVGLPDGRTVKDYLQIRMPPFAVVVACDDAGLIVCERHYRHGAGRSILTLPAGGVEPGEEPARAAARELLEETGYASDDWTPLGAMLLHANAGGPPGHMFLARGCRKIQEPRSADLEDTTVELLAPRAVLAAVLGDTMPLGIDMAALLHGFIRLGHIVNGDALG